MASTRNITKTAGKKANKKPVHRAPRGTGANANPVKAETSLYEVLEPFKFHGTVVKPPAWIELSADDALEYQEAGVLGTEEGVVPEADETNTIQDD